MQLELTRATFIFAELESKHDFVVKVRDLVKGWPRPNFIVMRYLFAFLNHLSEFRYYFPTVFTAKNMRQMK